ncbi:Ig-like domain repeat protein [Nocardioides dongkuii]|uniref:Ig-like domain repeat protein n=1 Tax=Nocardioides dongkuii TaxID=2760089 RepID=UPI0015FDCC6A|nr:Ig-like domain repeat protein [Nocardioides dongkuii]
MDTKKLRRRTATAVLAASCVIAPGIAMTSASAATVDRADVVAAAAPVNLTPPSIIGTYGWIYAVGDTVTADPGTWDTEGAEFSYEWRVGGAAVGVGDSYTPTIDDLRKTLTLTVTASKDGAMSEPVTSAGKTIEEGSITYLTLPSVTGDPVPGAVLTADPGTWDIATAVPEFQWYVGGEPVAGATARTYQVKPRDVGSDIYLGVTLSAPDYLWAMAFTDSIMVQRGTVTSQAEPRIGGVPVVGKTLTVKPGTWSSTDGVALSYRWTSGGKPVPGADGRTFTLRAADAGKQIGVIETAGGAAWNPASHSSAPVTATKAAASVRLKLGAPAAGKLKVSVVVRSTVTATGQVKVKVGQRTRTVTLRQGKATFTLAKVAKGKVKVTARYAGSSAVLAGADSASIRVK